MDIRSKKKFDHVHGLEAVIIDQNEQDIEIY